LPQSANNQNQNRTLTLAPRQRAVFSVFICFAVAVAVVAAAAFAAAGGGAPGGDGRRTAASLAARRHASTSTRHTAHSDTTPVPPPTLSSTAGSCSGSGADDALFLRRVSLVGAVQCSCGVDVVLSVQNHTSLHCQSSYLLRAPCACTSLSVFLSATLASWITLSSGARSRRMASE
jgi:hypothetical protein